MPDQSHSPQQRRTSDRLWTPYFVLIILIMFVSYVSFHGLNSGTSVYVDHQGGTAQFAGILASIYSISAALARTVFGPLIDERGRALIMRVGALAFAVGALVIGFIQAEWALVFGRVFQGIGFGALTTSAAAAAADVLPMSRLGEGLGYYGMGNALAQSIGPALALSLVALDPPELMYYALAGASIVVFILSALCRYEKNPHALPATSNYRIRKESSAEESGDSVSIPLKGFARFYEPHALSGALPMMFMSAANCFSVFFAALYGASLGIANGGIFFTFSAISMVVVRLCSKLYMDRILPFRSFSISVVIGLAGLTCMLLSAQVSWLFYLAGFLYGWSLGMTLPINQSVSVKNTPEGRWGTGSALFFLLSDAGVAISTIAYGSLTDLFGFEASIFGAMACMVVAFILAVVFYPPWAKSKEANREWMARHETR